MESASDGNFIACGLTGSYGAAETDVYLVKVDVWGDTLWTRRYGGPSVDYGSGIRETPDGGFLIVGTTASFGAGVVDVFLIRTDATGDSLWMRKYGGADRDWGHDLVQTPDMGYVLGGRTASFGAGLLDFYMIKIRADGDTIWTQTHGGPGDDLGLSVRETEDHGFIMCGYTESFGSGQDDLYLVTFRPDAAGVARPAPARGVELGLKGTSPFSREVGVSFECRAHGVSRLSIYTAEGRKVARLFEGVMTGGQWAVEWDGYDEQGREMFPGVYFVHLATQSGSVTRKVVLISGGLTG